MNAEPANIDAEKNLISSIMSDPGEIPSICFLESHDFAYFPARTMYDAIMTLYRDTREINLLEIEEELKSMDAFDCIGGYTEVVEFFLHYMPSSVYAKHFAKVIKIYSDRRKIKAFGESLIQASDEGGKDFQEKTLEIQARITGVLTESLNSGYQHIKEVLKESFREIEDAHNGKSNHRPIGIHAIDKLIIGFEPGTLVLLAARPGMGKTTLAMNIAINMARDGVPGAIFSIETKNSKLGKRILSNDSGVPLDHITRGEITEYGFPKLYTSMCQMSDLPIYFFDVPFVTIESIVMETTKLKKERGIKLVVIDHLQLVSSHAQFNREDLKYGYITSTLKRMARDLNLTVLCLSQLNRSLEKRVNKRPVLSDLRESGAIEQNADIVLFPYRPFVYSDKDKEKYRADIIIGKSRDGKTGTATVAFVGEYSRFTDLG